LASLLSGLRLFANEVLPRGQQKNDRSSFLPVLIRDTVAVAEIGVVELTPVAQTPASFLKEVEILAAVPDGSIASLPLHWALLARAEVVENAVDPFVFIAVVPAFRPGHENYEGLIPGGEDAALLLQLAISPPLLVQLVSLIGAALLKHAATLNGYNPSG